MAQIGTPVQYVTADGPVAAAICGIEDEQSERVHLRLLADDSDAIARVTGVYKIGDPGMPSQYPYWQPIP